MLKCLFDITVSLVFLCILFPFFYMIIDMAIRMNTGILPI